MNIQEIKKCLDELNSNDLKKLQNVIASKEKILILGNGGSNAIASHISQDFTKVLGKKSISFSDPSMLTCYANDFGHDKAFQKFVEHYQEVDCLVILISSSGNSQNILNVADFCKNNAIDFITLSGFSFSNSLKVNFDGGAILSFWVDSSDYGVVECVHQIILHSVL